LLNPTLDVREPLCQMLNRHPARLDSPVRFAPFQDLIARRLVSTRKLAHVWAKRLTANVFDFGDNSPQLFD
jgi:hypothetical protein